MEVYRYYRSLRDSLSDSRLKSLKSFHIREPDANHPVVHSSSLNIDTVTSQPRFRLP